MAQVTELVTKFLFEGNTAPLARYNAQLGASIKLLAGFVTAAVATGGALAIWAGRVLETVDALGNLSASTGVTVSRIQELGFAAQMSGSSAAALEGSLRGVNSMVGLAANGMGRGKEIFKELGIEVRKSNGEVKNAADILEEIRQRMNALNMSTGERQGFATRLGIDGSLVQYLSRTDDEMARLINRARELGTLTQEQAEAANEYNDNLSIMNYAMTAIRQQIAVGLAPALTDLTSKFVDLIAENKDWIINGIRVATEFISNLISMIGRLLPILVAIGIGFLAAKIYMLGFAGVLSIILSPVVLVTAAVAALLLIVDDLIVAFKGGDSVIGNFFKNFLGVDLSKTVEWLKQIWEYVSKLTIALAGKVGQFFGFGAGGAPQASLPPSVALAGSASGSIAAGNNDNRKIEQTVNIDVRSADPEAAGRAAADGVQRQLKDANAQLGVGGL